MTLFCDEIEALITDNKSSETLRPYIVPLATAVNHLRQATVFILNNAIGNPNNAVAASTDYLQLFGLVALGYMWAQIAITASVSPDRSNQPFGIAVLPGRGWCSRFISDAHGAQSTFDDGAIDPIPIADEVARSLVPRKGLC